MKKWVLPVLIALCLLTLCSCSAGEGDSAKIAALEEEISTLKGKIAELEEENRTLKGESSNPVADNNDQPATGDAAGPVVLQLNTPVKVGEVMEITITDAEWTDSVLPSDTSGAYSYYKGVDGETYFVVHGTITNYAGEAFDIQWNSESSILVNDKYTFSASMEFEDADGRGFGDPVKPLQTSKFLIYSSISDEAYRISETVQVSFALPDNEEQLGYFYDESHSNACFTISFSDLKAAE